VDYIKAMTVKRTKSVTLEELWDYEAKHPVIFASPRALADARLIANLKRMARSHRRGAHRNGMSRRRKTSAA
jgi:hypothetical protein